MEISQKVKFNTIRLNCMAAWQHVADVETIFSIDIFSKCICCSLAVDGSIHLNLKMV
jgi:hypothetical protein